MKKEIFQTLRASLAAYRPSSSRGIIAALAIAIDLAFVAGLVGLAFAATASIWPALVAVFVVLALLAPRKAEGYCYTATLILPLILRRVMAAYKQKLPLLKYFAFDISPDQVKFNQDIIAQMPQIPTARSHTPGNDLTATSDNVKDLIIDVPMKIDRAAKVVLRVPTGDAVSLNLDTTFQQAMDNAGYALAQFVTRAAIGIATSGNFSHSITEAAADVDKETLSAARKQLNNQTAGVPRFGIVSPDFMSALTNDPRIASGDYYGKLVDQNPYVTLENIEGFQSVSEFVGYPVDAAIATFVAAAVDTTNDKITIPGHGLAAGARVRLSNSGGGAPAGLAVATDYYVLYTDQDTIQLAATQGGAAIDITGAGTGTQTISYYEHSEAFFFAMPALLIAMRSLRDNIDTARQLGIPVPIASDRRTDPDTGLTFDAFMWIDAKTHDIYVAMITAFGVRGGRQASANSADSYTDRSGLRVVTA